MASLIAKKLAQQPIGTHIQVQYGDEEKIVGIITDSDFSESVEITQDDGKSLVVEFSLVRSYLILKKIEAVLKELPSGTNICFSYGDDKEKEPTLSGTVGENDNQENIEIVLSSGEELVLNYSLIRSVLIQSSSAASEARKDSKVLPEPPKEDEHSEVKLKKTSEEKKKFSVQQPANPLNYSDNKLKDTFSSMPKADQKKLTSVYESFKYGVKCNDREKMTQAAKQARVVLFDQDDKGYYWSCEAVLFCAAILSRVGIFDYEVLLIGECMAEAAYACWRGKEYLLAGTYALVAIIDGTPEYINDLSIILASSLIETEDISGIHAAFDRMPQSVLSMIKETLSEMLQQKGLQLSEGADLKGKLEQLFAVYPATAMSAEYSKWERIDDAEPEELEEFEEPEVKYGRISKIFWGNKTGVIISDDGETYAFAYSDIVENDLHDTIRNCMKSDLDGKTYLVRFLVMGAEAKEIVEDTTILERAKEIAENKDLEDRHEIAFSLCEKAVNTPMGRKALTDLVKYSLEIHSPERQMGCVQKAVDLFEKNKNTFAGKAFDYMAVARCYECLKKYQQMMECAEQAIQMNAQYPNQKLRLLIDYLKMTRAYYEYSGDKTALRNMLTQISRVKTECHKEIATDERFAQWYMTEIQPHAIKVECGLDLLEEAEKDFAKLPKSNNAWGELNALIGKTRRRLMPKVVESESSKTETISEIEPFFKQRLEETVAEEDESSEEILPYKDADGWNALRLTKKDVIDYALSISGENRIPCILAYLCAGAALNPQLEQVYQAVALAANDPMANPDYSITALVTTLANSDTDYPILSDCCMGAAFLRASFLSGRDYDYSAQSLRDSISIGNQLPALRDAYSTLEEFRKETGVSIDIYADYRNLGVRRLKTELEDTIHHADELYTKFILNPAREDASFARLLETKRIVFDREGALAKMLRNVIDGNHGALEKDKQLFIDTYLNSTTQIAANHISMEAVDKLITDSWDQAGKSMQTKKVTSTLQGNRRNNLRSSVSDILRTICQWYVLSEQNTGVTWRTEDGEKTYLRLRPKLMEQLHSLREACISEIEVSVDPEWITGLYLISLTAQELCARLDGSWKFEQEKYLYADFLRSNQIMLTEGFLPELSSTFCALPDFNVFARIRQHVEEKKLSFQEQIDRIYGQEKSFNNYGTADRILEYLKISEDDVSIELPENREMFVSYTEKQIDMRYRSFIEFYALALNYGQIIKSDAFCYTLEDTVKYWYEYSKETKNYGFFIAILDQAESQIHASAHQYETQLDEQLDALISSNQQYFDAHPDYAEAIRTQITEQNFTAAEDWMARIRIGDFSLDVQQPQALGYLQNFWNSYVAIYSRVADASRSLSYLLGRREVRNKDSKRAQQLIDNWISSGHSSNSGRIEQLLNLLGWQNINVSQYQFADEPRAEIYEVRKEMRTTGMVTPQHPIAAFGSRLAVEPVYVICLYGIYDCDRIYEKMRTLDMIKGNKIILLDYALGQTDRRALARKIKKRESGLRNVNLVIDRVLITFLANNYNENLINCILMATAMPFTYFQPYVVESILTMPPEIFIGRKDELQKIEQPDGVNLIYGGRQLGKSALFKKALSDIDGNQMQRAVLVDINGLGCADAAKKVSFELITRNVMPEMGITDDWNMLCMNLIRRIRNDKDQINYFLLMLDEADEFINDCANCNYRPLVALKDVQQSLPGQFKYVLAGLHNIVKFNRQVALGNNSVITHMPSLKITPFRTPEAQELLTGPLSYLGFSLPSKVTISTILATCNYFPGLIQLYGKKLIESLRGADYAGYDMKKTPPYVVSDEHLRHVMADKEFVAEIHNKFEATLTLDQKQGSYYYPLTLLIGWMYNIAPSKAGYTAKDVLYHAKDLALAPVCDLEEEKIDALLLELQDLNILRSVSNNSYLLASKNFRDLLGSDEEIFDKLGKAGGVVV